MRSLFSILMLPALILSSITGCKKESFSQFPVTQTDSIPFENNNIKIDFVAELSFAVGASVKDMHFFDPLTGIAITNAGEIYKTKNGGVDWTRQYASADSVPFYQILFINNNTGYAVGGNLSCDGAKCIASGGIILKTTDGGETWNKALKEQDVEFVSVAMNSKGELFAVGNGQINQVFKSADNGVNWSSIANSTQNFYKIIFNEGSGFCTSTSGGKLLMSRDNGLSWKPDSVFFAPYTADINFKDGIGFCITAMDVYKTTDNGNTWISKISGSGPYIVNPLTANSCIAFGNGDYTGGDFGHFYGAVWQTKDGGNNWINVQFTNTTSIICSNFYTSTDGYAVTGNKLLKITVK